MFILYKLKETLLLTILLLIIWLTNILELQVTKNMYIY